MAWVTGIVVAFLLVTVMVIVLARSSTARWERAKRATVVARRDSPPGSRPGGSAAWLAGAVVRRVAAPRHGRASARAPKQPAPGTVPGGAERVRPRRRISTALLGAVGSWLVGGRLLRWWTTSGQAAAPGPGDGSRGAEQLTAAGAGAVPADEGGEGDPGARTPFRRASRSPGRRTPRFLDRREPAQDPQTLSTGGEDGSAAR